MNELLKIILSLSLSGALLILVLLLCKPLVKDKFSKRWQYYIWLIVVVRLLLPFAPETSLMGMVFQHFDSAVIQTDISQQPAQESSALTETDFPDQYDVPGQVGSGNAEQWEPDKVTAPNILEMVKQNIAVLCLLVWLIVAACLLIRKITVYQSFVKYMKAGRVELSDLQLWERVGKLMDQTGIKGVVGLYTNSLISSPLLIGFFRPCIMLPTTELSESDFEHTILHELTHYKRRDMFYKWLVQVTICFHWFNPLVYLMGREVNRACELSCDEAVIKSLDEGGRRAYGDTLLNAMGVGGNYKDSLASVTLNGGKALLKERLDAIMKFKKTTRLTAAISMMLIFALCFGATAAGAYTNPKQQPNDDSRAAENQSNNPNQNITTVPVGIETVKNGTFLWLGEYNLSYGDKIHYDISAEKGNGLETGFAAPEDDPLNRTYFTISNKREDGTLETKGDFTFEAPVTPGRYHLFIRATDGDLTNVKGNITIENTQSPAGTPPIRSATENVKVNFSGITVSGQGPVGVELVKSKNSNVTFELLNMDKENTCTTDAKIVNGIMQITVNNDVPNGINVDFGPEYKNVVRIYIPDAVYTRFDIQTTELVVQMQDFHAPVHVESNGAGFWLIDDIVSQGTYNIKVSSGPIYIEADTILNDITANADSGPLTVRFDKVPTNLYLDTTNCGPVVERPDDWPAIYKIGNETPKMILSNNGKATVEIQSNPTTNK